MIVAAALAAGVVALNAQTQPNPAAMPRVRIPTTSSPGEAGPAQGVTPPLVRPADSGRASVPAVRAVYPWKTRVTCTVFWIGEQAGPRNPVPNDKSSWDAQWETNFGGYDDPEPANRIANHATGDFRPKGFVPKLNPFYVALPYNDVASQGGHKSEAARVIPWFARMNPESGKTVCKGRWLQIFRGGRSCFAQWEDCGPWETDDWEYVFSTKPPKTKQNGSAGLDLSPAIRDYLGMQSGEKVHWRFVEANQVPYGPWKKYGLESSTAVPAGALAARAPISTPSTTADLATQQKYIEYLRKLRDEQFAKKPLSQLQN